MQIFDKKALKRGMNKSAKSYDKAAKIAHISGDELLSRLDYIKCQPKRILDLGAGTGALTNKLSKRYPKSTIIASDLAYERMKIAKSNKPWLSKIRYATLDMHRLPFAKDSFDMVFSNQCLYWSENVTEVIFEIARVLKPGGVLLFSSLGPDTLTELRQCFAALDEHPHINVFLDMHELGDILIKAGFKDPVMDMENIKLFYSNLTALIKLLRETGERNYHRERLEHLQKKISLKTLNHQYLKFANHQKMPGTFEVIYGHALGAELQQQLDEKTGEIHVSLDSLLRKKT